MVLAWCVPILQGQRKMLYLSGRYPYLRDLLGLQAATPLLNPAAAGVVGSELAYTDAMATHPDSYKHPKATRKTAKCKTVFWVSGHGYCLHTFWHAIPTSSYTLNAFKSCEYLIRRCNCFKPGELSYVSTPHIHTEFYSRFTPT